MYSCKTTDALTVAASTRPHTASGTRKAPNTAGYNVASVERGTARRLKVKLATCDMQRDELLDILNAAFRDCTGEGEFDEEQLEYYKDKIMYRYDNDY